MNRKWIEQMEIQDDEWFRFFNSKVKWFILEENEDVLDNDIIDKYIYDKKGRMCAVELKSRLCNINSFNGIFIEEKKYNKLKEDFLERGFLPIYVNFFQDKEHVCIWDLRRYFNGKDPEVELVKINNQGYNRTNFENRYKLPQREGHFYRYNKETDRFDKRW